MAAAGKTIIFISHKLDEVLAIADRITVLRDGQFVAGDIGLDQHLFTERPVVGEEFGGRAVRARSCGRVDPDRGVRDGRRRVGGDLILGEQLALRRLA